MMDWYSKFKLLLVLFLFWGNNELFAQSDSIRIVVNDSTSFWHPIVWVKKDTVNGECRAVYKSDMRTPARIVNYKNGLRNGVSKSFFPTGRLMEKQVYKNGQKNGAYVKMAFDGQVLISGSFTNGKKSGMWNDKLLGLTGRFDKNGLKQGVWKYMVNDFVVREYVFRDGELQSGFKSDPPDFLLKY